MPVTRQVTESGTALGLSAVRAGPPGARGSEGLQAQGHPRIPAIPRGDFLEQPRVPRRRTPRSCTGTAPALPDPQPGARARGPAACKGEDPKSAGLSDMGYTRSRPRSSKRSHSSLCDRGGGQEGSEKGRDERRRDERRRDARRRDASPHSRPTPCTRSRWRCRHSPFPTGSRPRSIPAAPPGAAAAFPLPARPPVAAGQHRSGSSSKPRRMKEGHEGRRRSRSPQSLTLARPPSRAAPAATRYLDALRGWRPRTASL